MNFLSKIFNNEEKYVGLCSLKRANRKPYIRKPAPTYQPYYAYNSYNTRKNVYLAV